MSAIMKPLTTCRARPFVAAQRGQPSSQARTPAVGRITSAGKPALLALPALLARVPAAFAEEIEKVGDAASEAGRQALKASQVPQWSSVQVPQGLKAPEDVVNFLGDSGVNPLLLLGAVAAVAVPALLFQALSPGGGKAKSTTPGNVISALAEDARTQLVDIRSAADTKAQGNPDLSATKRRAISLPYTRVVKRGEPEEVVADWGEKLAKLAAIKPESIVILLDTDGKLAAKAAADIPAETAGDIYYVAGGATAWEASEAPWKAPGRGGFSLDLSGLTQGLAAGTRRITALGGGGEGEGGAEVAPGTIIAAGGALLGALLLFNQTGVFLEVVGLGAAAQLVSKNLLYAEDRERTVQKLKDLLDREIAVKEVGQDLQKISNVLLEGGEEVAEKGAAKVEAAAKDVKKDAKEVADKVSTTAGEVAEKVEAKAESATDSASSSAGDAAEEAKAKAAEAKEEAKSWIESWRAKSQ